MLKFLSPLAAAGALLSPPSLGTAPALALSPLTFVSGRGTDTGTCASPANPCRSFNFALGQTSANGEIKALDPASYDGIIITKSISITGVEGASINRTSGDHITINAGPNDTINLSYLILDGGKTASNGILLNSGGSLTIADCTIRDFTTRGITLQPIGATTFQIAAVTVSRTGAAFEVLPVGTGKANGTVSRVAMNENGTAIVISGPTAALVVDSTASHNNHGYDVAPGAVLRLAHSVSAGNDLGVFVVNGGTIESAGDNFIQGNDTDVAGTLTKVTTQ